MARSAEHTARHEVHVDAAPDHVFDLLADLDQWPRLFRPFVLVESLGGRDGVERVGMWATFDDAIEHWAAFREVDRDHRRLTFRPERPHPPVTAMERTWQVSPAPAGGSLLTLSHRVTADEDALDGVRAGIEDIAARETAAVRAAAEQDPAFVVVVVDTVDVPRPPEQVYAYLWQAAKWPDALAHVESAETRYEAGDAQVVEVVTREARGGTLTTRLARVGFPHHALAYKHLLLPPLGSSHHASWHIATAPGGSTVTSRQVAVVDEAGARAVLGDDLTGVRDFVHGELSTKARLLLGGA
ncbi:aromatase/bifunctional cyclase/aromatase [Saccharothrix carnea]|uniref:Aromatase/bifunctional cyclase/aromatase n=1 Tax=Saccharothrix carnea TaxID=1280637 RepID=A0A2P8I2I3_SACCR|nr:SRPBCC family protein [Saccharothrix carnea]PSL52671.1 aromatase/bifunctional cyclase/aromatase [Saccharothrix carnea]